MRHFRSILLLSLLTIPIVTTAQPLATVNGQAITEAQVVAANSATRSNPQLAQRVLVALINRMILKQQATHLGLSKSPKIRRALANERENLLINAALDRHFEKHPIDHNAIKNRYETMLKNLPKEQYRIREIVVSDYNKAKQIMEKLRKGALFSNLAERYSKGPNATLGGETGWITKNKIQAEAGKTLEQLKPLQVGGPINTPHGWTVIQLLQVRPMQPPKFADVADKLKQELRKQATGDYLRSLIKSAKITVHRTPFLVGAQ